MRLNLNDMFTEILIKTRIHMTPQERSQFMNKYLHSLSLQIDNDWEVKLSIRNK